MNSLGERTMEKSAEFSPISINRPSSKRPPLKERARLALRFFGVLTGILIAIITLSDWLFRSFSSDLVVRIKLVAMLLAWTSFIVAAWSARDILQWRKSALEEKEKGARRPAPIE